jgi:hypothetical protein
MTGELGSKGDFARSFINDREITTNHTGVTFNHRFAANPTMPEMVGVQQFNVGAYDPQATLTGYRSAPDPFALTPHNLFGPAGSGVGLAFDPAYIATFALGHNAAPSAGDVALLMTGTLMNYDTQQINLSDVFKFNAQFVGRKLWGGIGQLLIYQLATQAGTITGSVVDRGAAAASGTILGAVSHLHVLTPTGTQAVGTATFTTNAADADTLTIGDGATSVTYRFKTTPAQANDIQIGATSAATALNAYQAMIGSQAGAGTAYYTGTAKLPSTIQVARPASNVLNFTAAAYGTAGNAYTLAKTGTNITVSGATFSGGTAGDSYTVTVQSATSSGGSYSAFATFTSTMQQPGSERIETAMGVTINRYLKAVATTGGSTNKPSFVVACTVFYQ